METTVEAKTQKPLLDLNTDDTKQMVCNFLLYFLLNMWRFYFSLSLKLRLSYHTSILVSKY